MVKVPPHVRLIRDLESRYGKFVEIGNRRYRRFIEWPGPVVDGTCRCLTCGQIDEPEYHIEEACRPQS